MEKNYHYEFKKKFWVNKRKKKITFYYCLVPSLDVCYHFLLLVQMWLSRCNKAWWSSWRFFSTGKGIFRCCSVEIIGWNTCWISGIRTPLLTSITAIFYARPVVPIGFSRFIPFWRENELMNSHRVDRRHIHSTFGWTKNNICQKINKKKVHSQLESIPRPLT